MTVPITNVGLSAIQTNFGGANPIALSEYYRGGANVPASQGNGGYGVVAASGPLSVGTFRNQEKVFTTAYTISVDTTNLNLITLLTSLGWDGIVPVRMDVTINSGIVVSSNNTAIPALAIGSALPSGSIVRIYNYGYIIGMGGAGGNGNTGHIDTSGGKYSGMIMDTPYTSGLPGGPAIVYSGTLPAASPIQLFNYGTIGGGGGGGGGAYSVVQVSSPGGGGGQTGRTNSAGGGGNFGSYPGTFAGAGPGLVPSGHGNSGPGGGWGGYGGVGSAWPGDWTATNGGAGGAAIVGVAGFTVSVVGTRYGSVS